MTAADLKNENGRETGRGLESEDRPSSVRSMTGQGRAAGKVDLGAVTVELRSVNNRGFKCSIRTPESFTGFEPMIESVAREHLHRGSVNVSVHLERDQGQTPQQINEVVLAGYIRQCQSAIGRSVSAADANVVLNVAALTGLPGVLSSDRLSDDQSRQIWDQLRPVLVEALDDLVAMRSREGTHMARTLLADCAAIRSNVESIRSLAPTAADNYRSRLESKVKRVLSDYGAEVDTVDLLREVQIYADKADVSEEITRLGSHLNLFESVLGGNLGQGASDAADQDVDTPQAGNQHGAESGKALPPNSGRDEPMGRKLDFIIQEMFRETNTIGSKSAVAEVSAMVVEIKCAIERMRELVQNLE